MNYTEAGDLNSDGRMDTPAFHRNHTFVVEVVKSELEGSTGNVLEIASGSGQHALVFAEALPTHIIWPSDLALAHVKSIAAWRNARRPENLRAPFQLDVIQNNWGFGQEGRPPQNLSAIISLNMVHISPLTAAAGLFKGAGANLAAGGRLFLYGPFMRDGAHTAPSNAAFDENLRSRDPAWGIRDISALEKFAEENGLRLDRAEPMPSNNFTLIFERTPL